MLEGVAFLLQAEVLTAATHPAALLPGTAVPFPAGSWATPRPAWDRALLQEHPSPLTTAPLSEREQSPDLAGAVAVSAPRAARSLKAEVLPRTLA